MGRKPLTARQADGGGDVGGLKGGSEIKSKEQS